MIRLGIDPGLSDPTGLALTDGMRLIETRSVRGIKGGQPKDFGELHAVATAHGFEIARAALSLAQAGPGYPAEFVVECWEQQGFERKRANTPIGFIMMLSTLGQALADETVVWQRSRIVLGSGGYRMILKSERHGRNEHERAASAHALYRAAVSPA